MQGISLVFNTKIKREPGAVRRQTCPVSQQQRATDIQIIAKFIAQRRVEGQVIRRNQYLIRREVSRAVDELEGAVQFHQHAHRAFVDIAADYVEARSGFRHQHADFPDRLRAVRPGFKRLDLRIDPTDALIGCRVQPAAWVNLITN